MNTADKFSDDHLSTLKSLRAAEPSPEAKKLALNAAMIAFDQAQAAPKAAAASPGVIARMGRRWRLGWIAAPAGVAALAALMLPVGYQALNSTSMTRIGEPPVFVTANEELKDKERDALASSVPSTVVKTVPVKPEAIAPQVRQELSDDEGRVDQLAAGALATVNAQPMDAPASEVAPKADAQMQIAPAPSVAANAKMRAMSMPLESAAGLAMDSGVPLVPTGDVFSAFTENGTKVVAREPVSTFSIDVDTASYSYVRSVLEGGYLPAPDAVRLEELINYFPYDYAGPDSIDTPFKANMAVIPTPWNAKTRLLEIGIKGYVPPANERKPQNLTFLIDTSGSMDEPNKLPLLQRSFALLLDTLKPEDTVSIVAYAGSAGVVLEPTKAKDRVKIGQALMNLSAGGSTAGAEGIALAYQLAEANKTDGSTNRVILATDGDFNVGISDPEELKTYIKQKRDSGVFLSVLGFGRGNLDDALMQALAQNGNGNASYIDNFREAQKVLVEEGGANLVTIAKDVKIQVEFNPAVVSEYRLIGYETRALANEDFNNDTVDAGEIGAGHTVTAIYEITPVGSGAELNDPLRYGTAANAATEAAGVSDEIGFLKMRYKTPEGSVSKLITAPITKDLVVNELDAATPDEKFTAAVAAFGQKLKGSNYGEAMSWKQIADLANAGKGADTNGYRAELVQLINTAAVLSPDRGTASPTPCDEPGAKADCPPVQE